jgi:hypothetical protein
MPSTGSNLCPMANSTAGRSLTAKLIEPVAPSRHSFSPPSHGTPPAAAGLSREEVGYGAQWIVGQLVPTRRGMFRGSHKANKNNAIILPTAARPSRP